MIGGHPQCDREQQESMTRKPDHQGPTSGASANKIYLQVNRRQNSY